MRVSDDFISLTDRCPDGSPFTTLTYNSPLFNVSNREQPEADVTDAVLGSGSLLWVDGSVVVSVRPDGVLLLPPVTVMTLNVTVFNLSDAGVTYLDTNGGEILSHRVSNRILHFKAHMH